tara:strand:- start:564 stop:797 length:234 start_codon:yes stop_codon:yes gene_type:complete
MNESIYIIFEMINARYIVFDQIDETSLQSLRLSIDDTKTILKFTGETPEFLEGETQYSHSEILAIINDPENGWITNE